MCSLNSALSQPDGCSRGLLPHQLCSGADHAHAAQVNNFTFHYAFYVVMNWLPTYFDKVLKANLAELGPVKTLPYLIMFAMSNVGNLCGDWLIARGKWSVAAARKAVNTVGASPPLPTPHLDSRIVFLPSLPTVKMPSHVRRLG